MHIYDRRRVTLGSPCHRTAHTQQRRCILDTYPTVSVFSPPFQRRCAIHMMSGCRQIGVSWLTGVTLHCITDFYHHLCIQLPYSTRNYKMLIALANTSTLSSLTVAFGVHSWTSRPGNQVCAVNDTEWFIQVPPVLRRPGIAWSSPGAILPR
jgi:hypothetical protein